MTLIEKAKSYGFNIVSREQFMATETLDAYPGDEALNRACMAELHQRASEHPGAFVLYDPEADGEGFLLCGDTPEQLAAEWDRHEGLPETEDHDYDDQGNLRAGCGHNA